MIKLRIKLSSVNLWLVWVGLLSLLITVGLASGILVFWKGLSITNLTDLVPWGLWITIDLSSIALSAGAFSMAAAVYLIGLKRYQPIARTATFIGLIGYTMALLSLVLDIGRPDRFWHALVYWNKHSLLWEVTMCVTLYLIVLVFECLPTFASLQWLRNRFPALAKKMSYAHNYAPVLAVMGLGLSVLHQSSLGAVYGVLKARPFWFRPEMPIVFMFSAIIGGVSLTLFVSMLASHLTPRARINDGLIERLSHFVGWALVAYLFFRFWETLAMTYTYYPGRTEGLQLLTSGTLSFNFWVGEMLVGILVPMILLLWRKTRVSPFWRMLALAMAVGGLIAYRWDTNLSGLLVVVSYLPGAPTVGYASYRPSLIEYLSGLGIVSYGALALSLGVRYLKVVDHRLVTEENVQVIDQAGETVPVRDLA
jgi:molybdopterin-containing oxidoreductase family membrane subunit